MRPEVLSILACPKCLGVLKAQGDEPSPRRRDGSGTLTCEICQCSYPVIAGIPHLVLPSESGEPASSRT